MGKTSEPEPTRFTLRAAPGYAVSQFALGLLALMATKTAAAGAPYTFTALAAESGAHLNTINKIMLPESTFEASTLAALACAVGRDRWEDVTVFGHRVALLVEAKAGAP